MKNILKLLAVAVFAVLMTGCGRVVPPGTTILLTKANGTSEVKTEGVYYQVGRTRAYFIDQKLKSYPKDLKILCADEINMDVSVKWVGRFDATKETIDTIKRLVPSRQVNSGDRVGFELSLDQFFATTMEDMLSSITRGIVSQYKTDDIRENREKIREEIKKSMVARLKELKYPVKTTDILITNIDYPESVKKTRERIKQAELKDQENAAIAKAEVAKAKRDAELAAERGKARLVEAEADAAANRVRAESLTPEILLVKQLEMLGELAKGPNNNSIVIPFDAMKSGIDQTLILKDAVSDAKK